MKVPIKPTAEELWKFEQEVASDIFTKKVLIKALEGKGEKIDAIDLMRKIDEVLD